jgi:cytochrome c553
MRALTFLSLILTTLAPGEQPPPVVVHYCSGCHESSGNAELPFVPRLAGQHQSYLAERLKSFRQAPKPPVDEILHLRTRSDASMIGVAHALSNEELEIASRWYSGEAPKRRGMGDSKRGRDLYVNGSASRTVQACANCHSTPAAPVIAGQNASYVVKQLELFRKGIRTNPVMNNIARNLADDDAKAVAAYLGGNVSKN